jgi:hypothetical protein
MLVRLSKAEPHLEIKEAVERKFGSFFCAVAPSKKGSLAKF